MAHLDVIRSDGNVFTGTLSNDIAFYVASNQKIHIGPPVPGTRATMTLEAAAVRVIGEMMTNESVNTPTLNVTNLVAMNCTSCNMFVTQLTAYSNVLASNITTHAMGVHSGFIDDITRIDDRMDAYNVYMTHVDVGHSLFVPTVNANAGTLAHLTCPNVLRSDNAIIETALCGHFAASNIMCRSNIDCLENTRLNILTANKGTYASDVFVGNQMRFGVMNESASTTSLYTMSTASTLVINATHSVVFCEQGSSDPLVLVVVNDGTIGVHGSITIVEQSSTGRLIHFGTQTFTSTGHSIHEITFIILSSSIIAGSFEDR